MEQQALQDAIKSDLATIPTLKMGILSAGDLYGSLGGFILKMSLTLLGINLLLQTGMHSVGLYYPSFTISAVLFMWVLTLGGSCFIAIFLSPLVLFSKLVKGRLKTEAFIKQKWIHACLLYCLVYAVIYGGMTLMQSPGNLSMFAQEALDKEGWDSFYFMFAELWSLLGSFMLVNVLVSMEVNRLGIGVAMDVINKFVERVKSTPFMQPSSNDGSDDNAR